MFALHAANLALAAKHEVDVSIWSCSASSLYLISVLQVDQPDDFLELKPVQFTKFTFPVHCRIRGDGI